MCIDDPAQDTHSKQWIGDRGKQEAERKKKYGKPQLVTAALLLRILCKGDKRLMRFIPAENCHRHCIVSNYWHALHHQNVDRIYERS